MDKLEKVTRLDKRVPIFSTFEEYVSWRLDGVKFIQAYPLIDEYGTTYGIGVFYYPFPFEKNQPARYMELERSDRLNEPWLMDPTQVTSEKRSKEGN